MKRASTYLLHSYTATCLGRRVSVWRAVLASLVFVLLLLTGGSAMAQSTFSALVATTNEYHIERQPDIVSYQWEVFTDAGLVNTALPEQVTLTLVGPGRDNEISVTWKMQGIYYLAVNVVDTAGCTNRMAFEFEISGNQAPIAVTDYITVPEDAVNFLVNVLANDSDPDGHTLSIGSASVPVSGGQTSVLGARVAYSPPANFNGNDYFLYEVCDNGVPSLCSTDTVFVVVTPVNDAPVAVDDELAMVMNPDQPRIIYPLDNDVDVDGDPLTLSIITGSVVGGVSSTSDGKTVTYMPPVGFVGVDSIVYRVCDNATPSLCDIGVIRINVMDELIAVHDDYTVAINGTYTLDILDNDSYNGTIQAINALPALGATSAAITVEIIDNPTRGTAQLLSDGSLQYTTGASYTGYDSLIYRLSDGYFSDTALVVILINPRIEFEVIAGCNGEMARLQWNAQYTGVNETRIDLRIYDTENQVVQILSSVALSGSIDWPGATLDEYGMAVPPEEKLQTLILTARYENTPLWALSTDTVVFPYCHNNVVFAIHDTATIIEPVQTIRVLDNDFDPDDGEIDPKSLALFTQGSMQGPYHGKVTVKNGTLVYQPNIKYSGNDQFAYTICDDVKSPYTACDTAIVRVKVIWTDKVIAYDDYYRMYSNADKILDIVENDYEPNGTFDLNSLRVLSGPDNGTATVHADGTITYLPTTDFVGLDSFSYEICNSKAEPECDQAWVYIEVVENFPIVANHDSASTTAEKPVNIPIWNNDYDPEGAIDILSVVIHTLPQNGTLDVEADGTITYRPKDDFAGADSFIYRICDQAIPRTCDTAIVRIDVIDSNMPIVATRDQVITAQNIPVDISLFDNDFDPDGQIVVERFAITVQPKNGTLVVGQQGVVTYRPTNGFNGSDSFIYRICDNGPIESCDTALVTINVYENFPPEVHDDYVVVYGEMDNMIDILLNDGDVEGRLDKTSVEIVSGPNHGTVTVNEVTGSIVYTPDSCYFSRDTLRYRVYDEILNTGEGSVFIDVRINPYFDTDNDGLADEAEDMNSNGNPCDDDSDDDGIPNYRDDDDDNDNVLTKLEDWNDNGDPSDDDTDGDGTPNYLDTDDDDDTILTMYEDPNNDGDYLNDDTDFDTIVNHIDDDDDGDEVLTRDEPGDLDDNGVPDYLEIWNSRAIADFVPVGIEEVATIDVLANDSSQMAPSTLFIVTYPTHGNLTIDQSQGVVIYTPGDDYIGPDQFVYEVCDYYANCDTAVVNIDVDDRLVFPELFTPNNDGDNDTYTIVGVEKYPENKFEVFNRWGNKVYEKKGYTNDWDGVANVKFVLGNKELPAGVYYFIFNFSDDQERSGAFFLMR